MFKSYRIIKNHIRSKIREDDALTSDSVLFYDANGDLLQETWSAVTKNADGSQSM
jgi:hypothetical protein